jgi:TonB-dependent receptor
VAVEDESEPLVNSYIGTENVYSGYLMATQSFGPKFEAIAGMRLEHTVLKFEGTESIAPMGPREYDERADYSSWLPSLHLKYTPTNKAVLRAAYSKMVSRQSFNDIKPSLSVNITGDPRTYRIGNPGLLPWFSHNFDLMGEYYPNSIGMISAGLYHKSIQGFNYTHQFDTPWSDVRQHILDPNNSADKAVLDRYVNSGLMSGDDLDDYTEAYNQLADTDPFESTQRVNSDAKASITGVELAYQCRLDFLPGALGNLSLYANYTHNWISKPEKNEAGTTVRLPGTASDALNLSLAYEAKRVSARLSYNYTSAFLSSPNDADEYRNRYCDAVNYLDLNVDYHIVPNKVILTASANNLLNEVTRYYYWQGQYTASNLGNGARFQLGVIVNLF